jgi:hypothetical protein
MCLLERDGAVQVRVQRQALMVATTQWVVSVLVQAILPAPSSYTL